MTPDQIVCEFEAKVAMCLDRLMVHFERAGRIAADQPLMLRPRDGGPGVRTGRLAELGTFSLHGAGCRFELDSGEHLDIDWDADGRAVFDSWRVLMFARSIGETDVSQEALERAAQDSPLLALVRDRWFTWSDHRYDLTPVPSDADMS